MQNHRFPDEVLLSPLMVIIFMATVTTRLAILSRCGDHLTIVRRAAPNGLGHVARLHLRSWATIPHWRVRRVNALVSLLDALEAVDLARGPLRLRAIRYLVLLSLICGRAIVVRVAGV